MQKKANMTLVDQLVSGLQTEMAQLPDRFYDSFDYTTTGRNCTHPITLGLLAKVLWRLPGVRFVAIDFRLNDNGAKFQPDVVALAEIKPIDPLLFLDYESPNSCDRRIPAKDVDSYEQWSKNYKKSVPYFIVTTLPNKAVDDWELRYTSAGGYNHNYAEKRKDIRGNPFVFWYREYEPCLGKNPNIYFINMDGKRVYHVRSLGTRA